MVGTGGQVRFDALANLLFTPPGDHCVDQAIATPIVKICSRKSLRQQNPLIVLLAGVKTQMLPSAGARLGSVAFQDSNNTGADPGIVTHHLPCTFGMLR